MITLKKYLPRNQFLLLFIPLFVLMSIVTPSNNVWNNGFNFMVYGLNNSSNVVIRNETLTSSNNSELINIGNVTPIINNIELADIIYVNKFNSLNMTIHDGNGFNDIKNAIFGLYPSSFESNDQLMDGQSDVDELCIYDDDFTQLTIVNTGSGQYSWNLLSESSEKQKGNASVKLSRTSGNYSGFYVDLEFNTSQDWSSRDVLSMYLYGANTSAGIWIEIFSPDIGNYFQYHVKDDWIGWRRIIVPLNDFEVGYGSPSWLNITKIRLFDNIDLGELYYVDRIVIDSNAIKVIFNGETGEFGIIKNYNESVTVDVSKSYVYPINSSTMKLIFYFSLDWDYLDGATLLMGNVYDFNNEMGRFVFVDPVFVEHNLYLYNVRSDRSYTNPSSDLNFLGNIYYENTVLYPDNSANMAVNVELNGLVIGQTNDINQSNGEFIITNVRSESMIGNYSYTLYLIVDDVYIKNSTIAVVVDRINIIYFNVSNTRVNVNSSTEVELKAVLEYDGRLLEEGDYIQVNLHNAVYDDESKLWRTSIMFPYVTNETLTVTGAVETDTNITVYSIPNNLTCVWDKISLFQLYVSDTVVPPSTEIRLWADAKLEYDGHLLGEGDFFEINGVKFLWNSTMKRFEAIMVHFSPKNLVLQEFTEAYEMDYRISIGDMNNIEQNLEWNYSSDYRTIQDNSFRKKLFIEHVSFSFLGLIGILLVMALIGFVRIYE